VTYTPDQVRAQTPYRRTIESRAPLVELRDLFLCHAWGDRRGVATELNNLLEAKGVSVCPVAHGTTYEEVRKVSPLLGSRHGLDTTEDAMQVVATKIAEPAHV
jgi:hypothetical protein